jgi:hypothetical protein
MYCQMSDSTGAADKLQKTNVGEYGAGLHLGRSLIDIQIEVIVVDHFKETIGLRCTYCYVNGS